MIKYNGGPAFPVAGERIVSHGMSLRDWFAGQALANRYTHSDENADKVAEWAYQVADAMLYARDK